MILYLNYLIDLMALDYINVKIFIRLAELEKVICCQKGDIDSAFSPTESLTATSEAIFPYVEILFELFKKGSIKKYPGLYFHISGLFDKALPLKVNK